MSRWRRRQSAANRSPVQDSLATGKEQGIFAFLIVSKPSSAQMCPRSGRFCSIPYTEEQGILSALSGNGSELTAMDGACARGSVGSRKELLIAESSDSKPTRCCYCMRSIILGVQPGPRRLHELHRDPAERAEIGVQRVARIGPYRPRERA